VPRELFKTDKFPEISKCQLDWLAMSLIYDLTRVATIQFATVQQGGRVFSWLGHTEGHHSLSHSSPADPVRRQQLIEIGNWYASQIAYLCKILDSVPEGDGTVLDNTMIYWCSDISIGQQHTHTDMPLVLVGGGGGALRTGRRIKYDRAWHNDLRIANPNAMGVPVTTFGNPAYCKGPLAGVLV